MTLLDSKISCKVSKVRTGTRLPSPTLSFQGQNWNKTSISNIKESLILSKLPTYLQSLQRITYINRTSSIQYSGSSITNREITRSYHISIQRRNQLFLSLVLRPIWIKDRYISRTILFSMTQLLAKEALCLALINF